MSPIAALPVKLHSTFTLLVAHVYVPYNLFRLGGFRRRGMHYRSTRKDYRTNPGLLYSHDQRVPTCDVPVLSRARVVPAI
jgi:hypothetical protein